MTNLSDSDSNRDLLPKIGKSFFRRFREGKIFSFFKHLSILILLFFFFLVNNSGVVHETFDNIGSKKLAEANKIYIENSEEAAAETFLLFSAMKAGLAIMQSSRAGISFIVDVDLQVGHFLQSMKELVDIAWAASFFGMSALFFMTVITSWSEFLTIPAINIFLLALFAHHFTRTLFPRFANLTTRVGVFSLFIVFATHVIIPLTIFFLSLTSAEITEGFSSGIHKEISDNHQDLIIDDSGTSSMKEQAHKSMSAYNNLEGKMHSKLGHLTKFIVQHIVVIFFNVIVFPLVFFVGLAYLFQKVSIYIFKHSDVEEVRG